MPSSEEKRAAVGLKQKCLRRRFFFPSFSTFSFTTYETNMDFVLALLDDFVSRLLYFQCVRRAGWMTTNGNRTNIDGDDPKMRASIRINGRQIKERKRKKCRNSRKWNWTRAHTAKWHLCFGKKKSFAFKMIFSTVESKHEKEIRRKRRRRWEKCYQAKSSFSFLFIFVSVPNARHAPKTLKSHRIVNAKRRRI